MWFYVPFNKKRIFRPKNVNDKKSREKYFFFNETQKGIEEANVQQQSLCTKTLVDCVVYDKKCEEKRTRNKCLPAAAKADGK
jgi:predicted transcriptional regulator of viral defense system